MLEISLWVVFWSHMTALAVYKESRNLAGASGRQVCKSTLFSHVFNPVHTHMFNNQTHWIHCKSQWNKLQKCHACVELLTFHTLNEGLKAFRANWMYKKPTLGLFPTTVCEFNNSKLYIYRCRCLVGTDYSGVLVLQILLDWMTNFEHFFLLVRWRSGATI